MISVACCPLSLIAFFFYYILAVFQLYSYLITFLPSFNYILTVLFIK